MLEWQNAGMDRETEEEQAKIYANMDCETCGKGGAMRCKGCGTVAYCGRECQKKGWKGHRRECGRRKKRDGEGETVGEIKVPYETI